MANTASNVSTGKPAVAGAIYVESASTSQLPTSATATLTGFTSLGFISEDGLTNANTSDSTPVKEWGGATVLTIENNYNDTFQFTLLESLNPDVLKEVFGAGNVTGSALSTGYTVKVKPEQHNAKKWVVDMVMNGGVLKRICLPAAAISAVAEIAYRSDEAVGYNVTLTCTPDGSGNTHYEYIQTPASPGP